MKTNGNEKPMAGSKYSQKFVESINRMAIFREQSGLTFLMCLSDSSKESDLILQALNRNEIFGELLKTAEVLVYDYRNLDGIRHEQIEQFENLIQKAKQL